MAAGGGALCWPAPVTMACSRQRALCWPAHLHHLRPGHTHHPAQPLHHPDRVLPGLHVLVSVVLVARKQAAVHLQVFGVQAHSCRPGTVVSAVAPGTCCDCISVGNTQGASSTAPAL